MYCFVIETDYSWLDSEYKEFSTFNACANYAKKMSKKHPDFEFSVSVVCSSLSYKNGEVIN